MELNIIHDAQQLALEQGEAASNSEDDSSEDYDAGMSNDESDEGNANFIPMLKLKGKNIPKEFKAATGGKKCMQKGKKDANNTFYPFSGETRCWKSWLENQVTCQS